MFVTHKESLDKLCPYKAGLEGCSDRCVGTDCMAFVENRPSKGFCGMMNNIRGSSFRDVNGYD